MARWTSSPLTARTAAVAAALSLAQPAWPAPPPPTLCVAAPVAEVHAAKLPHTGQARQVHSCRDKEGHHLLFATQVAAIPTNPDLGASEVHFYQFTEGLRGYRKRWEIRDFAQSTGVGATIHIHHFEPLDLDSDGLIETYMAYGMRQVKNASDEAKLVIHSRGRKTTIRGMVASRAEDYASRNPDPTFFSLPREIQEHALEMWDKLSLPLSGVR